MVKSTNIVKWPLPFLGACRLFNIQPIDALYCFTSMLTPLFFVKQADVRELILTRRLIDCLFSSTIERVPINEANRIIHFRYIKKVLTFLDNVTRNEEETQYTILIDSWYNEAHANLPSKTINTCDGLITLSNEFCILSELMQFPPVVILEYYINNVVNKANPVKGSPSALATELFMLYAIEVKINTNTN